MDEVRQKLTKQERAHLSNLWEDKDTLHSLSAALSHQQLSLAQSSALMTTDFNQVMELRGKIEEANWIVKFLKYNHREIKRSKEKAEEVAGGTLHSQ